MTLKKVINSVIIQYVGKIVGLFLSLITIGLLTRYLGVSNYGIYTSVLAIAGFIITLADFGFFWSTIQNILKQKDQKQALQEILGIKTALTLILIIAGFFVVNFGNFSEAIRQSYLIVSIFIIAGSLNSILIAYYQAYYKMVWPTVVDVLSKVLALWFIWYGAKNELGLSWFIIGVAFSSGLMVLLNWLGLVKTLGYIRPKIFGFSWASYYQSVFLIGFMQLFSMLYYRLDILLLTWLKPATDVGIYGIAVKVIEVAEMPLSLFVGALFPILVASTLLRKKFLEYTTKGFEILAIVCWPICIYGIIFAKDIVRIVGGSDYVLTSTVDFAGYSITAPIVLGLLLAFVLITYQWNVLTVGLLAGGKVKTLLIVNVIAVLINATLNLLLIPHYSYLSSAVVAVVTQIFVSVANSIFFYKHFGSLPSWKPIGKVILALIPGILLIYIIPDAGFMIRIISASLLYVVMVILFIPEIRTIITDLFRKEIETEVESTT